MVQTFLVALIAGICKIDNRLFGMTMIQRPLIVSTLVGIVYGNVQAGLAFGAQMELLSMGLVGIGAHSGMPEITVGSAICAAFICGNGTGADVALTLSLPISTFCLSIGYLTWIPLNHMLSEKSKVAATKADIKTMEICQWLGLFNYFFFPFLLTLVGLMVNEAVPKFAVGSSTGFMGFFQYIFGETLATALIGVLVSKYGWLASNIVLYSAATLALLLLIYIMFNENRVAKLAKEENNKE